MWQYLTDQWSQIWFASWQHLSLVVQCTVLATLLAIVLGALVHRNRTLAELANGVSAVGLTIPSFALIAILVVPFGFGVTPSVVTVTFFAVLPILRNTIVGLNEVEPNLIEAARGVGMSGPRAFFSVELPLAWPVILAGVRVSAQMSMGVAAITAYALGPGLGGMIFTGLSRLGGANALNSVVVAVVAVVILAQVLDLVLVGLGRLSTPRGIRVKH
ncbi:ABC transporter permease [Propionimicrobium sp. PCR01-08-3]|uniref:ABC transporter permease n=1 Tax=Propionimicrobium sp. PCR01-08-3 TaxID=3052086 RepID=UPI00255CAE32|nr:ABC transporter permease [Propionimicrobium sp. PCR01-08-3]WIY81460.1 ABC transporter permease [Propionimicrobium sp. PCR01-08-3]